MQQQQQQQDKMFNPTAKDAFNFFVMLAAMQAATIYPAFRRGAGTKGKREGLAFLLLGAVAALSGMPIFWGYLVVWMVIVVARRVEAAEMRRKGWSTHTEYTGWPILADQLHGSERTAKLTLEPLVCVLVAAAFGVAAETWYLPQCYAMCLWFGVGAVALIVDHGIYETILDRQADVIRDKQIEQENVLERFHEKYGR
jgi:hypothetical protein